MAESFELKVDPEKTLVLEGSHADEIAVQLSVTNPTESAKALKVKCTDNSIFQINPAVSFIDPGKTSIINIKTKPKDSPPQKRHHFVVFHMEKPQDATTPRKAWEGYQGQDHRKTLTVEWKEKKEAKQEEKKEAKEEPKEEEKKDKKEEEKKEKKEEEPKDAQKEMKQ